MFYCNCDNLLHISVLSSNNEQVKTASCFTIYMDRNYTLQERIDVTQKFHK